MKILTFKSVESESHSVVSASLRPHALYSPPGSSVHGILQARLLEGAASSSLIARLVKNLPAMQETWVQSLGWEGPWRRKRLRTPIFRPGEFRGLDSPWGRRELDTTERLSLHFTLSRGSSETRGRTWVSCIEGRFFTI